MKFSKKGKIKRLHFDWTEILKKKNNANYEIIYVSKNFSFLQFRVCFALLKKCKIPIFNAAEAIKTTVSVK